MKNVKLRSTPSLAFASLCLVALSGCSSSSSSGVINLRVLNWEDYIGEGDVDSFWREEGAETSTYEGVLSAFEAYEKEVKGKNVHVIYDTFDTNETMMSSLKTGKSTYDLICPSEYTIEKMMDQGMLEPFDQGSTPSYDQYASPYLLGQMQEIQSPVDGSEELHPIAEYARGYMWGTLGILYNPAKVSKDKGIPEEEVLYDMDDWNSLWDDKYKREMSVKDSMRDTYAVGIMRVYDQEIRAAMASSGFFDEELNLLPGKYEEAMAQYGPIINEIFNRSGKDEVAAVKKALMSLKANVFGFEVDSGKDDIVKGLIGMNIAWSGDAVYSMNRGENEAGQTIYYSLPRTGGNIWFDGWVMPKSSSLHKEEAEDFVDFLSSPQIASSNMDTIGYSSFIAGDYVHELIREWYDPRSYEMYVYHDASNDPDCTWEDSDFVYDEEGNLVYKDGTGVHKNGDDYGSFDMRGSSYEEAVVSGVSMSWEAYEEKYNAEVAESEDDALSWDTVNLTYIFEGTLSEETMALTPDYQNSSIPDGNPYYFYTDQNVHVEDPYGNGGPEVIAGRQFMAQYVPQEMIPKLASMKDYGSNNKYVLAMWEDVKGNNLPVWGVVVFSILLGSAAAMLIAFWITKVRLKKIKVARRKEAAKALEEER